MHNASAMPNDRIAQVFPTSRVLTVITAEPAAALGLPWAIEDVRENPFDA